MRWLLIQREDSKQFYQLHLNIKVTKENTMQPMLCSCVEEAAQGHLHQ